MASIHAEYQEKVKTNDVTENTPHPGFNTAPRQPKSTRNALWWLHQRPFTKSTSQGTFMLVGIQNSLPHCQLDFSSDRAELKTCQSKESLQSISSSSSKKDGQRKGTEAFNRFISRIPIFRRKEVAAENPVESRQETNKESIHMTLRNVPLLPQLDKKVYCKSIQKSHVDPKKHQAFVRQLLFGKAKMSKYFKANYQPVALLGEGSFGFVIAAKRLSDQQEVAIKFLYKNRLSSAAYTLADGAGYLPREVFFLRRLDYPFVISLFDYFDEDQYYVIVTELHGTSWDPENPELADLSYMKLKKVKSHVNMNEDVSDGLTPLNRLSLEEQKQYKKRPSCDLFECIDGHMSEEISKRIFAQIILAIDFMHRHFIIHRDLKDENIVIDKNYEIRIVDFGSASFSPDDPHPYFADFCGTSHYAAPEIIKSKYYSGKEAEIWSLGILLFTLLNGVNPFQTKQEIVKGHIFYNQKLSKEAKQLIQRLLDPDFKTRITMEEIMQDPWIKDYVRHYRRQVAVQGYF